MMLVPEKSRDGTNDTACCSPGIAAKAASMSSPVISGISDNRVQMQVMPAAANFVVASRTATLSPRGYSSFITIAPVLRASIINTGSQVTTVTRSGVRAVSAALSTSRNMASARALLSLTAGSAGISLVLAKASCFAAIRTARTAVSYNLARPDGPNAPSGVASTRAILRSVLSSIAARPIACLEVHPLDSRCCCVQPSG